MSTRDLDTLREELPDLFEPRDPVFGWHEGRIIVPVRFPERIGSESTSRTREPEGSPGLDQQELEEYGIEMLEPGTRPPSLPSSWGEAFGGHPGAPIVDPAGQYPLPDALAFYLPFHFYLRTWWGIYLVFEGVVWLASEILKLSGGQVSRRDAFYASRLFLYHHEAFHHKTECFATRLELTHRQPLYRTKFESLYRRELSVDQCVEESLANASALNDTHKKTKDRLVDLALTDYVRQCPLRSYSAGAYVRDDFVDLRCEFAESNQHQCFPHLPRKRAKIWKSVPQMFTGIANIKSPVSYVVLRHDPLIARTRLRLLPTPTQLARKLRDVAKVELVRHGGNHDIYQRAGHKPFPIPRHPRDIHRGLLKKILTQAGLDMGVDEFLSM